MEIVIKGKSHHVQSDIGEAMVAAGIAVLPAQVPHEPQHTMKWWAAPGPIEGDFRYPPAIHHSCGCGRKGYSANWEGKAYLVKIPHCTSTPEAPPSDVQEEYRRLFEQWRGRSKRAPHPPVAAVSAAHDGKRSYSAEQLTNYKPQSAPVK
jgi:hypothetical protein